jgi:hypothetical protein
VTLTVSDGQASTATSESVVVNNVAPTTGVAAPATAPAGSTITLSAVNAFDVSPVDLAAGLQYAFDCGYGLSAYGASSSTTCTVAPFGSQSLTVSVRDKDGGIGSASTTLTAISEMNVQPATISLSLTGTVSVYLYSTAGFDATKTTASSSIRLMVNGSGLQGAPVATRNGAWLTSVGDYNGDGRPDRLFVFLRTDLQTAGLTLTRNGLTLQDLTGAVRFMATDPTPPSIVP